MPEPLRVRTRHAELSLEEVAEALPGTGQVMAWVSHAFGMCWHAAHGGNSALAAYYLSRSRNLLRGLAVTRPKYAAQIRDFEAQHVERVREALAVGDLEAFDAAYQRAVDQANTYHADTGHPYIRWSRPERPAEAGLDLGG